MDACFFPGFGAETWRDCRIKKDEQGIIKFRSLINRRSVTNLRSVTNRRSVTNLRSFTKTLQIGQGGV